jgi:branched-chain amino acid transport system permease protein
MKATITELNTKIQVKQRSDKMNIPITLGVLLLLFYNITPYLNLNPGTSSLIQFISINIIMAISLYVLIVMDMISLAQSGFMAVGAYTSVLLALNGHTNIFLLLAASIILSSISGLVLGLIVSKVRGVYFVLLSFSFSCLVTSIITNTPALGGANGFSGLPALTIGSYQLVSTESMMKTILIITTIVIIAGTLWSRKFKDITSSIHEDENLSKSLGLNAVKFRTISLCLSAGIAGVGGLLMSFYLTSINPDTFHWLNSVDYLAYNIVGGLGSIVGPLIGTVLLEYLSQSFNSIVEYSMGLFGLILIVFTILLRGGIYGVFVGLCKRLGAILKK